MSTRGIHHIAITAADLEQSGVFYDGVLVPLGYHRHLTYPHILTWRGPGPDLLVYLGHEAAGAPNQALFAPGIHHIAFQAADRESVDAVFAFVRDGGYEILDEPAVYDRYSEGYYAVYMLDPDGIKIEVAHIPVEPD